MLISSFLVSTRSKSLLGNFLWWRISAKTSAPPFDLASILHHKKFPAAFRPCTNQETQKYLLHPSIIPFLQLMTTPRETKASSAPCAKKSSAPKRVWRTMLCPCTLSTQKVFKGSKTSSTDHTGSTRTRIKLHLRKVC